MQRVPDQLPVGISRLMLALRQSNQYANERMMIELGIGKEAPIRVC